MAAGASLRGAPKAARLPRNWASGAQWETARRHRPRPRVFDTCWACPSRRHPRFDDPGLSPPGTPLTTSAFAARTLAVRDLARVDPRRSAAGIVTEGRSPPDNRSRRLNGRRLSDLEQLHQIRHWPEQLHRLFEQRQEALGARRSVAPDRLSRPQRAQSPVTRRSYRDSGGSCRAGDHSRASD